MPNAPHAKSFGSFEAPLRGDLNLLMANAFLRIRLSKYLLWSIIYMFLFLFKCLFYESSPPTERYVPGVESIQQEASSCQLDVWIHDLMFGSSDEFTKYRNVSEMQFYSCNQHTAGTFELDTSGVSSLVKVWNITAPRSPVLLSTIWSESSSFVLFLEKGSSIF